MIDWYYREGANRIGPVSDEQIKEMASQGKITAETMVWNELIGSWKPYGSVSGTPAEDSSQSDITAPAQSPYMGAVFGQTSASYQSAQDSSSDSHETPKAESYCNQCYKKFPNEDLIRYGDMLICAECKNIFFQRLREGSSVGEPLHYAGFWIRFVAKFIDGVICSIVSMFIMFAVGFPMFGMGADPGVFTTGRFWSLYFLVNALNISFDIFYKTFFVGKFGATPGKMALGLKVVTPDGGKVSYMRAFARYFGELLSGLILLIGYIMAAFDDEKRALHDRICGTRVIRK